MIPSSVLEVGRGELPNNLTSERNARKTYPPKRLPLMTFRITQPSVRGYNMG